MISSRLSKRYAKALLSIGQEDGNFERYGRELNDFARLCRENEQLLQAISSKVFTLEERKGILRAILDKSEYSDVIKNFLNLLVDKDRIAGIQEISDYYGRLTDEVLNIARAEVITPRPLKEDATESLEKVLESFTSKKIRMEIKQDESLIGGIVVKVGDLVLDGSIRAQLEGLKESLKRGEYR